MTGGAEQRAKAKGKGAEGADREVQQAQGRLSRIGKFLPVKERLKSLQMAAHEGHQSARIAK